MDPVSFAASLFALIQAAHAGGKGLAKLKSCFNAPPEIARLKTEVESLGQLLEAVQNFMHSNAPQTVCHNSGLDILSPPVKLAATRIGSVNTILASPAFGISNLNDANLARLTILRYKTRLATLEREIKESVQEIGVRLSLVTARAAGKIDETLNIFLKIQENYSQNIVSSLEKLLVSHFETAQCSTSDNDGNGMTRLNLGQRRQTEASVRTLPQHKLNERSYSESSLSIQRSEFKKRYDCRPGCNCSCHIKRALNSPWLINTLLGELNIYWRSQKSEVRCNCSGHKGVAVIYRFPQYLLQRYISIILQTTYLDGPELVLRVPRVLPWTHLLWRYSVCGDLMAIKRMYADRIASPYDVDPAGRNALLYASKQESVHVAEFLLEQGADSNQHDSQGRPPSERLLVRSFGGRYGSQGTNIMRRILSNDDSYDEFGFTTLHKIILGLNPTSLATILRLTTDTLHTTDSLGRTPLFWAVIRDNASHVKLLLSYDSDPNARDARGYTPLDFVRSPAICALLLDAGATININPKNWYHSSLHEQVIENGGSAEVMTLFHAAGFDIDIKDHDNETPLLNAIYAGHTEVVKTLIDLGADVNAANISSRDSALHFAAAFDRPTILEMLLDKQADYTALDCNGQNLAHRAARTASTKFINTMAKAGLNELDLTLRDSEGKTAGEYMMERIVLTDAEVGVHEAWEELVEKLGGALPGYDEAVEELREDVEKVFEQGLQPSKAQWKKEDMLKIPGAFPVVTVEEICVGAF
ncbi:hypothetical protein P7C71_g3701, partial [Lecanoromycetidae sp. Uapishka_2]